MADERQIARRFSLLASDMDERMRRLFAAAESLAIGYGGVSVVSRATGVSRRAIDSGIEELNQSPRMGKGLGPDDGRVRKKGGGRKKNVIKDTTLEGDLERLLDPAAREGPESPLRWTCKSIRKLAGELQRLGHKVSHTLVAELLKAKDYNLPTNGKTIGGASHPDRNAQFEYMIDKVKWYLGLQQPVISVDTQKKVLLDLQPGRGPEKLRVPGLKIGELGKAPPNAIYDSGPDSGRNLGWVNVGIDHATAAFAVESIDCWWRMMGHTEYPRAQRLLITADAGGSNRAQVKRWKVELQRLSDETGLAISVCHFPPGTFKWNHIEQRMTSTVTQNWHGKPIISREVVVNLIAAPTHKGGLHPATHLDTNVYPKGITVSKGEITEINLTPDEFHGAWNYTIAPRPHST